MPHVWSTGLDADAGELHSSQIHTACIPVASAVLSALL